jgi:phage baseplate assembly protein W
MDIDFPWRYDARGRTAAAASDDHIRDMLELLLFTDPGERVNRPDFGSGVRQLVFAPNSPEFAAALEFTVQAAIQRELGDVLTLEGVSVTSEEATIRVVVDYVILATGLPGTAQLNGAP